MAASLLGYITSKRVGFKITKNKLSSCWIKDCCTTSVDVLNNSKSNITKFAKLCGISSDMTAREKLYLIGGRSVLSTEKVKLCYLDVLMPFIE